jgi:hypothetical protein
MVADPAAAKLLEKCRDDLVAHHATLDAALLDMITDSSKQSGSTAH